MAKRKTVVYCQLCSDMASSKHQEVDVLDNWEDIDESDVLEKKFSNLQPPSQQAKCNGTNGAAPFNIILSGDDALRSQYTAPEPTVTILKRPTKQNHASNENKVLQPKKTLKQREQEYAEARLRILGEAPSPEKPAEEATRYACIQNKPARPDEDNVIRLPKGPDGTKGFERR